MAKKGSKSKDGSTGTIAVNRKARFDYSIIEKFEAGMVLTGNEIKSIRSGGINLADAYVRPQGNEIFLIGAHIKQYTHSSDQEYNPTRTRKLLMHKREINKLRGQVEQKGMTIVPLRLYIARGYAKLEIGLAKGKEAPDKRQSIIDRERKREAERAVKDQR